MDPTCLPGTFPPPSYGGLGAAWCPLPAEVLLKMHSIPPPNVHLVFYRSTVEGQSFRF